MIHERADITRARRYRVRPRLPRHDLPMMNTQKKKGVNFQLPEFHTDLMIAHIFQILGGTAVAIASGVWISVADAVPVSNWWEASPWLLCVSALSYAVVHLWRALQGVQKDVRKHNDEHAKLQRETIEEQQKTTARLAKALERLDKDGGD